MQRRNALQGLMTGAAVLSATAFLAACQPAKTKLEGIDITGAAYGKNWALSDAHGQKRTIGDFAGKVVVVFFGFTQCPDVCPTTLQELAEAKAMLGAQSDKLQGIFVTVDPERDTPQVLRAYTEAFDPAMVALTGSLEQIEAVAKDFKVFFKKVPGKLPGTYSVDHSAGIYMYDTQGQLRAYHRYGQGAAALAKDAKALLGETA